MANSSATIKYLLIESDNSYSTVQSPLKSTQRVKYTCFDVSPSFLVFGATSGGLYVFRREPCTFLQLLPNKEGAVSHVAVSPDERLVAFASVRGTVCVLQRADTGATVRCLNRSEEHRGASVTAVCWGEHSDQVFVGDGNGRLSVINVSLFMSKNMFHVPAFVFMQVDSGVVSVSCHGDRLLVSSHTRCYVCDTAREQYRQIGTKLRDGRYAACYLPGDPVRIFCARPGSRLWEVDEEGVVLRTHQLKQALARPPEIVIHHSRGVIAPEEGAEWPEQSFNFAQLSVINDQFLFTFRQEGIYLLDPDSADVILWSNCYRDIADAKCIGDIVYVWTQSHKLHALQLTPIDKCLLRLYFYKHYDLCSQVCVRFASFISESPELLTKLGPLLGLREVLKDLSNELQDFLKHVESHAKQREFSLRLESGIFLVDNHHARWRLIERSKSVPKSQRSLKSRANRSRSLPPNDQNRNVKPESPKRLSHSSRRSSASTNSLPELSNLKTESVEKEANVNKQELNKVYNQMFDSSYHEYVVPQIPFFPLASPDIIHDALMEIGNSVSGKLVSGTKSLIDRWHKHPEPRANGFVQSQIEQNPEVADGEIVENQSKRKTIHQSLPDIDVSELEALCNDPKAEVTIELLENILNKSTIACNHYNEILVTKKSKFVKGVFPFSHYLSKERFLVLSNLFYTSFKNGAILQWLYNQQGSSEETPEHPEVLQDVFSLESLQLDASLSKVLRLFSEILDPHSVLECLEGLGLPCVYVSWCVVIDRFQEGTFRYITRHGESDNISCTDWPMPLLLNAIFLSFRLDQVDSSYRMAFARNVPLKTISYILLKLIVHLEVTGMVKSEAEHRCNNLLLSYVLKMISKKCEVTLNDIGLVSHIESAFVQVNTKSNYGTCHCSFPLPGASGNSAKFSEIGEKLISYHWEVYRQKIPLNDIKPDLLSHTSRKSDPAIDVSPKGNDTFRKFFEEQSDATKEICSIGESEYLKHIMKICSVGSNLLLWTLKNKAPNNGSISLQLVIQLGLQSEFEDLAEGNQDEAWWDAVASLNCRVKRGECVACLTQWVASRRAGLDWAALATAMLAGLGGQETLAVLKRHANDILPGELDYRFVQSCIVTSLVDSRVKMDSLRPKVMDLLKRAHHKTGNRALLSPQAGAQLNAALEADGHQTTGIDASTDVRSHWGVCVNLTDGDCSLCSLSLGAPRLLHDSGLRVFACSHAFHLVCLRVAQTLLTCPVCAR